MKPRIIFFGNSSYSVICEKALHTQLGLTAVVTIPDRLSSGKRIQSPVKLYALTSAVPTVEADKLSSEVIQTIAAYSPDFLVVADYGLILPEMLLTVPSYAAINIHHSLLPKFRGPSPAPATILSGDVTSGVSIIIMDKKVDAGNILKQIPYKLTPYETTDTLLTTLNTLGSHAVIDVINLYITGNIHPIKQDEEKATFTSYIHKSDGFIDSEHLPDKTYINRMIRAYHPWPGTWSIYKRPSSSLTGKHIKFIPEREEILLQVAGKKKMTKRDFLNGYPFAKEWLDLIL